MRLDKRIRQFLDYNGQINLPIPLFTKSEPPTWEINGRRIG